MGPANSKVVNQLDKPLSILTFNNADNVYANYNHLYQVAPHTEERGDGEAQVEAAADSWGLKVGIAYGQLGDQLLYRMWFCPNGSTLTVHSIFYDDIQASGCEHIGTNQIGLDNDTMSGVLAWLGITAEAAAAAGGFYT
jgi:hypothetical protein